MLIRALVSLTLAIPSFLLVESLALATPPDRQVLIDQGNATLPDINCGSFSLHEDMVSERIVFTTFFDDAGNPVRQLFTVNFVGTLTRLDTGQAFVDRVAGTDTINLLNGTSTSIGRKINIHIPGQGTVAVTAGRTVYGPDGSVTFSAGPTDVDPRDPGPGLCAALA